MINATCPHCNHHLEIPDSYAGQTGACANCKRHFTVPTVPLPVAKLQVPVIPTIQEQTIWSGKPGWASYFTAGQSCLAVILLLFFPAIILQLICIAVIRSNTTYIVTNRRIIARSGIFTKHITETQISDIRSIDTFQSLWDQTFRTGTLTFGTAAQPVKFRSIPNHLETKQSILALRANLAGG